MHDLMHEDYWGGTTWWPGHPYDSTASPIGSCPYCSGPSGLVYHSGLCPKIKAKEYYPNGGLKRIEFHGESSQNYLLIDGELRPLVNDYPPLFYERVIDEVVKKLTDCSSLIAKEINEPRNDHSDQETEFTTSTK